MPTLLASKTPFACLSRMFTTKPELPPPGNQVHPQCFSSLFNLFLFFLIEFLVFEHNWNCSCCSSFNSYSAQSGVSFVFTFFNFSKRHVSLSSGFKCGISPFAASDSQRYSLSSICGGWHTNYFQDVCCSSPTHPPFYFFFPHFPPHP